MLTVRHDSALPMADQIVAGLRGLIAAGSLLPQTRLPTVRQLAGDLGVNMNTVSRAYQVLESQGLVSTRRGRGTTVTAARERGAVVDIDELDRRVRQALADARLAGLDRAQVQELLAPALDALWPKED